MSCKYIYFHFPTKFEYELCKRIAEMTKPKSSKGQENCNENKLKEVLEKKIPISTVFSPFLIKKRNLIIQLCVIPYTREKLMLILFIMVWTISVNLLALFVCYMYITLFI